MTTSKSTCGSKGQIVSGTKGAAATAVAAPCERDSEAFGEATGLILQEHPVLARYQATDCILNVLDRTSPICSDCCNRVVESFAAHGELHRTNSDGLPGRRNMVDGRQA